MDAQELLWILIIGVVCMGIGIYVGVLIMCLMHCASPDPDEESNGQKE